MTQRIFDVDNPQDVKDLFDIIPDRYIRITRDEYNNMRIWSTDCGVDFFAPFAINWHNKTEITRPVDESEWIGCLCWFTGSGATCEYIGILKAIVKNRSDKYQMKNGGFYSYCRPVRRDEVQFADDADTKE